MISKIKDLSNASTLVVGAEGDDQRVDNFLFRHCRGVPRSHIYRILRTGQVRVNSGRVDATQRLREGDRVRVPPIRLKAAKAGPGPAPQGPELPLVYEDDGLLVLDKPSGVAVHGGSGISFGVIERMRAARPKLKVLELVHRLDRDTSGLLMLAKKRSILVRLHESLRAGEVDKRYLVLVKGRWTQAERSVSLALRKYLTGAGERRVSVDSEGKSAQTVFRLERRFRDFTLLSAELRSGRTHQIRVHLAHLGYPIAGDDKYGDFELNRTLSARGLKRMFLHAAELTLTHPGSGEVLRLTSPLPAALAQFLETLGS
ncbi:MAG: RluA family pseudouridine synthase [Betaproteobacteria bacterium]|nr:RluA family pseudouridine synthase [Betaproteobacteria bacterium]